MRSLRSFCLVLLLLLVLPALPCRGAGFPLLAGPSVYAGEFKQENDAYDVLLVLTEEGKFLLKETLLLPNGKHSVWEAAGNWEQTRGGAFLALANEHNFSREINVGGFGNLYLSMQMPTGGLVTVTLRHKDRAPEAEEIGRIAVLEKVKPEEPSNRIMVLEAGSKPAEGREPVARPVAQRKAGNSFELARAPAFQKIPKKLAKSWKNGQVLVHDWKSPARHEQHEIRPEAPVNPWQQRYLLASFDDQGGGKKRLRDKKRQARRALAATSESSSRTVKTLPLWEQTNLLAQVSEKLSETVFSGPTGLQKSEQLVVAVPAQFHKNMGTATDAWQRTYLLASLAEQGGGKKARRGKKRLAKLLAALPEPSRAHGKVLAQNWQQRYLLAAVPQSMGITTEEERSSSSNTRPAAEGRARLTGKEALFPSWGQNYLLAASSALTAGENNAKPQSGKTPQATPVSASNRKQAPSPALLWQQRYILAAASVPAMAKPPVVAVSPTNPGVKKTRSGVAEPEPSAQLAKAFPFWKQAHLPSIIAPKQEKQPAMEKRPVRRHVGELRIVPGNKLFDRKMVHLAMLPGLLRQNAVWSPAANAPDMKQENRAHTPCQGDSVDASLAEMLALYNII